MGTDIREEIANYLLNNCFLVGTEDSMRERYFYVLNHENAFQEIFAPIGYTLIINRSLRVIQLVNIHGLGRVSLRKYESIMLLILRLLYMEKRESLSTNADRVLVSVAEIAEEYEKLNLPRKFDQKLLEESLVNIRRFNLAAFVGKPETKEAKIQIYPSVMLALPDNAISQKYDGIREFLEQYNNSSEDEE